MVLSHLIAFDRGLDRGLFNLSFLDCLTILTNILHLVLIVTIEITTANYSINFTVHSFVFFLNICIWSKCFSILIAFGDSHLFCRIWILFFFSTPLIFAKVVSWQIFPELLCLSKFFIVFSRFYTVELQSLHSSRNQRTRKVTIENEIWPQMLAPKEVAHSFCGSLLGVQTEVLTFSVCFYFRWLL